MLKVVPNNKDWDTRNIMSQTKFYEGYSRWDEKKARYETWEESVTRVMNMHRDYYADKIIQALQGAGAYADGLDAAFELYTMITMDEGERHPAFPSDEKSRTEIMDFLDHAIGKLQ